MSPGAGWEGLGYYMFAVEYLFYHCRDFMFDSDKLYRSQHKAGNEEWMEDVGRHRHYFLIEFKRVTENSDCQK